MPACGIGNAKRSWLAIFWPKSATTARHPIAIRRNCPRNPSRGQTFSRLRTRPNGSIIAISIARSQPAKRNRPKHTSPMSVTASIRQQLTPIHREGYPFIGGFALASLVLFWIWPPLGWLGVIATLWCIYFFRDPSRVTPIREGIVVAPADGRVCQVVSVVPPRDLDLGEQPLPRISIFMSVFDCHINRSPVGGH